KFQHNRHLHHYFQPRLQAGLRYWEGRIDRCSLIASSRSVRRRRGFQPIADVAHYLGDALKIPVSLDISKRRNQHQSHQNFKERFWQMHNALEPGRNSRSLAGQRVLIVEDVYTTGSTANEAARVLTRLGASRVDVLSLVYRPSNLDEVVVA
ncbi:MAG: ComF family protein, partial [Leptospiraceae bacterium]|nr:ComF family protein [Leptospiraceae bacterium]